nr:hypothetical protein DM860_000103 [Ipomoea batatas]GMD52384.1 hypothetical protein DM860_000103 [Ipomoea batatas]GMD89887.1 hypothetical protein DM860_000103 [Ipomoea batatas]GME11422.1 hypothetical protein DM860_000103 [Ipomoea batatas]
MEVENNKEAKVSGIKSCSPTRLQKKAPVALKLDKEEMVPYNPFISVEDGSSYSSSSTQIAIPLLSPVVPPPPPPVLNVEGQSCSQIGLWCHPALEPFPHPSTVLAGFKTKCTL